MRSSNYFSILVISIASICALGFQSLVVGQETDQTSEKAEQPKYSDAVMTLVRRALRSYDVDESGSLEANEIKKGTWASPPPKVSDQDGDGVLTEGELAERYKARLAASNSSDQSDSSDQSNNSDQNRSARNNVAYNRYARYAKSLMTNYDSNADGLLDKDELKKMRRPPTNVDFNSDGLISLDELTNALSGKKQKQVAQTKSAPSQASSEPSNVQRTRIEVYVESLLDQYDEDENGRLSAEEVKKMRRPPQRNADSNADGSISRTELANAISGAVAPEKTQAMADSSAGRQSVRRSRQRTDARRNSAARSSSSRTRRTSPASSNSSSSASSSSSTSDARVVRVDFHLVQISEGIDASKLKELADKINQTDNKSLPVLLSEGSIDTVISHDQMFINVMSGREFSYNTEAQQSQVVGQSRSRQQSYREVAVGQRISLVPEIIGEHINLSLEVRKTFVDSTKSKTPAEQALIPDPIRTFHLETVLVVRNGTTVASVFSESDRQWLVVASAEF